MDPAPPHGVPDLCPECGAYWGCEHKPPEAGRDDRLWQAQYQTSGMPGAAAAAIAQMKPILEAFTNAIAKTLQPMLEAMQEFVKDEDDQDPEWAEWAHADWLPFPHRFRSVGAVDAAISAAAAALDWHAERPRGPPRQTPTTPPGRPTQIGRPPHAPAWPPAMTPVLPGACGCPKINIAQPFSYRARLPSM